MNNRVVISCDRELFKNVDMYIHSIELNSEPTIKKLIVCGEDWEYSYHLIDYNNKYYYVTD